MVRDALEVARQNETERAKFGTPGWIIVQNYHSLVFIYLQRVSIQIRLHLKQQIEIRRGCRKFCCDWKKTDLKKAHLDNFVNWPSDVGPYNKLTVFLHVLDKASKE